MAYDRNNIFARILRGEIPSHRVHEDELTLAFMDVMPQADGHTLVIPKAEAESILDVPEEALAAVVLTTQRVARAVKKAFDAPGILIAQLNGRAAGQSVATACPIVAAPRGLDLRFHARKWRIRRSLSSMRHGSAPPPKTAQHGQRVNADARLHKVRLRSPRGARPTGTIMTPFASRSRPRRLGPTGCGIDGYDRTRA